jgi:hypothetical protein
MAHQPLGLGLNARRSVEEFSEYEISSNIVAQLNKISRNSNKGNATKFHGH